MMQMFFSLALLALSFSIADAVARKLIIDSDLLNFDDDPLALGLANVFASCGELEILGVMSSISSRYVPPAIDAINTFYGHGHIAVAIQKPVDNSTIDPAYPQYHEYVTGLTHNFPQDIRDGSNTTDPVSLYRLLLSSSPDGSVAIAIIGFHDNLYHLLKSPADNVSALTGEELVQAKVAELIVQGNPTGLSYNFVAHSPTFAEHVLTRWPGLVTFVPDAIGDKLWIGSRLTTETDPTKHPVAYSFATCIGVREMHPAWDAAAIYYAARGLDDVYAFDITQGEVYFNLDGSAAWNYGSSSTLQRSLSLRIQNQCAPSTTPVNSRPDGRSAKIDIGR